MPAWNGLTPRVAVVGTLFSTGSSAVASTWKAMAPATTSGGSPGMSVTTDTIVFATATASAGTLVRLAVPRVAMAAVADFSARAICDWIAEVIPAALSADRLCPGALGDRSDLFRHLHELVPGFTAGIDDGLVARPHTVAEPVTA